ncbi:isoprenyl transferase 1 [Bryobacterales bacterium F-183]|nr:isoprenyl transferase 1 [Bryobacterales bacterium F-183]
MNQSGLHVAIIMDGNGRWAQSRNWPRAAGHRAGMEALRRTVEAAPKLGITTLTVYAFSSDNWKRPAGEVRALMALFRNYIRRETAKCIRNGVRVSLIGRRDRLPLPLPAMVDEMETETRQGRMLHLRLAVDYSGRDAILAAVREGNVGNREEMSARLGPDVDLVIRTSGEQRVSDFLIWESAYAEFHFCSPHWPDFGAADLALALEDFRRRNRRFGATTAA